MNRKLKSLLQPVNGMICQVSLAVLLAAPPLFSTSIPAIAQQQDLSVWCVNEYGREWFGSRRTADDAPLCTGPLAGGSGQMHREVDAQRLCPGGTVRFTGAGALYECVEISAASAGSGPLSLDAWCQNRYGDDWFGSRRLTDDAPLCTSPTPGDGGQIHREVAAQELCESGLPVVAQDGKSFQCEDAHTAQQSENQGLKTPPAPGANSRASNTGSAPRTTSGQRSGANEIAQEQQEPISPEEFSRRARLSAESCVEENGQGWTSWATAVDALGEAYFSEALFGVGFRRQSLDLCIEGGPANAGSATDRRAILQRCAELANFDYGISFEPSVDEPGISTGSIGRCIFTPGPEPVLAPGESAPPGTEPQSFDIQASDLCPDASVFVSHFGSPTGLVFQCLRVIERDDGLHRIVRIESGDSDRRDRLKRAQNALYDARGTYESALKIYAERQEELSARSAEYRTTIETLEKRLSDARDKHRQLAETGKVDPTRIAESERYKGLAEQIEKNVARIKTIDSRIEYMRNTYPASDQFAQNRIKALADEQVELAAINGRLAEEQARMLQPNLTETQADRIRSSERDLEIVRRDIDRRRSNTVQRLDRYAGFLERASNELAEAEKKVDEALAAVAEATADDRVSVVGVDGPGFKAHYVGTFPELKQLNDEIYHRTALSKRLEQERERARRIMIESAKNADIANELLLSATYRSLFSQYAIESVLVVRDLAKAATQGGAAGVLSESWRTFAGNLQSPPSYYDGAQGRLEDYLPDDPDGVPGFVARQSETVMNVPGKIPVDAVKTSVKEVWKQMDRAVGIQHGLVKWQDFRNKLNRELGSGEFLEPAKVMDNIQKQNETLDKIREEFNNVAGNNGKLKQVSHFGKAIVKGLIKGALKEAAKKEIAHFLEQPYFDDYMRAQLHTAAAIRYFRAVGDRYWPNEDKLAIARAARDALAEVYLEDTGWAIEENDLVRFADGGRFTLKLATENADAARRFQANVLLQGYLLTRSPTTATVEYIVPDHAAAALDDFPEEGLRMVIRVQ